jgi:hypothetical protein
MMEAGMMEMRLVRIISYVHNQCWEKEGIRGDEYWGVQVCVSLQCGVLGDEKDRSRFLGLVRTAVVWGGQV